MAKMFIDTVYVPRKGLDFFYPHATIALLSYSGTSGANAMIDIWRVSDDFSSPSVDEPMTAYLFVFDKDPYPDNYEHVMSIALPGGRVLHLVRCAS